MLVRKVIEKLQSLNLPDNAAITMGQMMTILRDVPMGEKGRKLLTKEQVNKLRDK